MLSRWATEGLEPDLTVVLDLPPDVGLARARGRAVADRLESESLDFHQRVRQTFLALAEADPDRYLVVDARQTPDEIAATIRVRVGRVALRAAAAADRRRRPSTRRRDAFRAPGSPHHPHAQTGSTPQLHP